MLEIKNNKTIYAQGLKRLISTETEKATDFEGVKKGPKKMDPSQTTKFFYPKNGLYGLL